MAKIIQFPGAPAGTKKTQHPKRSVDEASGPAWADHVNRSAWWRLAKTLFDALLEGPINLDKSGGFSSTVLGLPEDSANHDDIELVRAVFTQCGHIAEGKRSISLTGEGFAASLQAWTLWPRLFTYCRDERPWLSNRFSAFGPLVKELVPRSLGFLRAATSQEAMAADKFIDLALYNLDIVQEAATLGVEADLDDISRRRDAPMDPLGVEWYRLTMESFALPLGLVDIVISNNAVGSSWMGRARYSGILVQASPLLLNL